VGHRLEVGSKSEGSAISLVTRKQL
jgi:hypothetical protein